MSHIIKAITKEVQDKLTPMLVLEDFIEGNSRFIANKANTAIATGPFITTSNDIFGILIYFMIAKMILGI